MLFALAPLTMSDAAALSPRAEPTAVAQQISGHGFDYTIARGDSFSQLGSRYGEGPMLIARENDMRVDARLGAGRTLKIDNRHIVPMALRDGVIVNVPQRMLFYFKDGGLAGAWPIAVGKANPRWHTPTGEFTVAELRRHPTWHVPPSIQNEMAEQGKEVIDEVEPGPDNPLGDYFIALSIHGIGIHATNVPLSIYSYRTHGCIRLHPDDAETLFNGVRIGTPGEIVYQPLMLARLPDGRVFLESDRDIYSRGTGGLDAVRVLAAANHIENLIDWTRAAAVIRAADGIARDVTLKK
ncbi:MAG TPA: L,D-transpeptidase family protein [Candidatus Binataceae bacterium]|nr:L,D-transpeptidase family protein [Candidatus Binataceae bacterium]